MRFPRATRLVLLFEQEHDARRVLAALPGRLAEFGLKLHPDKTRLIQFRQPPRVSTTRPRVSFNFLGFTHFWGRSRKGTWIIQRRTAKDRFTRSIRTVREWCRRHRHAPIVRQHVVLRQKLLGHYAYYGITGNSSRLLAFKDEVQRAWRKWLSRRSSKARMTWERFNRLLVTYPLPRARIMHTYARPAANPPP